MVNLILLFLQTIFNRIKSSSFNCKPLSIISGISLSFNFHDGKNETEMWENFTAIESDVEFFLCIYQRKILGI